MEQIQATGKRKEACARVILREGDGKFIINKRDFYEYFGGRAKSYEPFIFAPFYITQTQGKFDCLVNVSGGGTSGQAGAIRYGIAKALVKKNEELKQVLNKAGLLKRDTRIHERKKYGLYGRRRRFQFSKR
ncbi:TPA: 30S ribosomal protein S9 [bacterium]|nr:30S ribosomal protein S9 [bacterium]